MRIDCTSAEEKAIMLEQIWEADYREVFRLHLCGYSTPQIADEIGYSTRQIERIISRCWREVCIRLAKAVIKQKSKSL